MLSYPHSLAHKRNYGLSIYALVLALNRTRTLLLASLSAMSGWRGQFTPAAGWSVFGGGAAARRAAVGGLGAT